MLRISPALLIPGILGFILAVTHLPKGENIDAITAVLILFLGYAGIGLMRFMFSKRAFLGETLVLVVILLNIAGGGVLGIDIFGEISWYDTLLHWLAGIALGTLAVGLFTQTTPAPLFQRVLRILGFVALAGVGWEFVEFAFDQTLHTAMQADNLDTMTDLAADLLGGGVAVWYYLIRRKPASI